METARVSVCLYTVPMVTITDESYKDRKVSQIPTKDSEQNKVQRFLNNKNWVKTGSVVQSNETYGSAADTYIYV